MILNTASNQWASRPADQRFQTLEALRASVQNRRCRSRSVDIDIDAIEVADHDGTLVVNSAISPVTPTHWGFTQLSGWAGAPAGYLRKLPVDLVARNLNASIKRAELDTKTLKFMTLANQTDGEVGQLAAVTSSTYGRIWDADVVDACQRIVDHSGGRFHNPLAYEGGKFGGKPTPSGLYASDHDVFMFMIDGGSLLEAGPRAKLNRGFFTWNSEVGSRSFGLMTFLFNTVCGNHFVYGAQNINKLIIRHTSGGPARFEDKALPALIDYANASAQPEIDAIKRAQELSLRVAANADAGVWESERTKVLVEFAKTRKVSFTTGEVKNAIETAVKEEGQCETLWDFVQGVTAYARGFDYIDARIDLEKRAGDLLQTVTV